LPFKELPMQVRPMQVRMEEDEASKLEDKDHVD
jgi:hypothetical protein